MEYYNQSAQKDESQSASTSPDPSGPQSQPQSQHNLEDDRSTRNSFTTKGYSGSQQPGQSEDLDDAGRGRRPSQYGTPDEDLDDLEEDDLDDDEGSLDDLEEDEDDDGAYSSAPQNYSSRTSNNYGAMRLTF